ncbi:phage baseplate assembly protein W [Salibacterium salarium]|uniref:contractile injection system sheath initiator n=1 Tax=Salibacterium salarium TaxID=284579 RepID=UPI002781F05F|nr:hypothetical protein [Salibacterium salarium]MDQ0299630.1 phage baseplate assembly protein W [Salibacterium salarium]
MKALKINKDTGDIEMENGVPGWVENNEELVQEVRSVVKTNIGEWFLDPVFGTDHNVMVGKNVTEDNVSQALEEAMEQVDRVEGIRDITINMDYSDRELSVFFYILVNGEEVQVEEVIENA